jgi:hypothetical protein
MVAVIFHGLEAHASTLHRISYSPINLCTFSILPNPTAAFAHCLLDIYHFRSRADARFLLESPAD